MPLVRLRFLGLLVGEEKVGAKRESICRALYNAGIEIVVFATI